MQTNNDANSKNRNVKHRKIKNVSDDVVSANNDSMVSEDVINSNNGPLVSDDVINSTSGPVVSEDVMNSTTGLSVSDDVTSSTSGPLVNDVISSISSPVVSGGAVEEKEDVAKSWRNRLATDLENNDYLCQVVVGSGVFLTKVGVSLNLPLSTIILALVYFHIFYCHYSISGTDRKFTVAACLLLSWKYWEDTESNKDIKKLSQLTKVMHESQVNGGGGSTNDAKNDDYVIAEGSHEFNRIKRTIKTYETALLRAMDYDIAPVSLPIIKLQTICSNLWKYISDDTKPNKSSVHSCEDSKTRCYDEKPSDAEEVLSLEGKSHNAECKNIESKPPESSNLTTKSPQNQLYDVALGICVDFYYFPYCLDYKSEEIAAAAAWKAGTLLGLSFSKMAVDCNAEVVKYNTMESLSASKSNDAPSQLVPWLNICGVAMNRINHTLSPIRIHAALRDMRHVYRLFCKCNIGGDVITL